MHTTKCHSQTNSINFPLNLFLMNEEERETFKHHLEEAPRPFRLTSDCLAFTDCAAQGALAWSFLSCLSTTLSGQSIIFVLSPFGVRQKSLSASIFLCYGPTRRLGHQSDLVCYLTWGESTWLGLQDLVPSSPSPPLQDESWAEWWRQNLSNAIVLFLFFNHLIYFFPSKNEHEVACGKSLCSPAGVYYFVLFPFLWKL